MENKHHGMRSKPAMEFLCNLSSYDIESNGGFGRIFGNNHYATPLYSNPIELKKLGKASGPMDVAGPPSHSTTVPAGMVFLGQFIDHDITLDTMSSLDRTNNEGDIINFRTPCLDLDCIFGEGREDEPFLYESDSFKLLTGETNNNIGQGPQLEKHDLPRNGQGVALIGDPRNDENRILSQLQLLFIKFYNKIYDDVADAHSEYSPKEIYEEARKITTWHYQWIVLYEFLPAMIGQDLLNDILANGRQWYRPRFNSFIPVEFSVAAFRFGHSMIPQEVTLQAGQTPRHIFHPSIGRGFSPLSNLNQVVEWNQFFAVDGSHQFAEKLDTKMASILLDLPFISEGESSLATRNLLRGNSFLLPSGETVSRCMGIDENTIARVTDEIRDEFNTHGIALSHGTPLWYYILMEAQEIGKDGLPGEGLGPMGGRIVGETILGLIENDHNSFLAVNRQWSPTIGDEITFGMKDLIAYAEMI